MKTTGRFLAIAGLAVALGFTGLLTVKAHTISHNAASLSKIAQAR